MRAINQMIGTITFHNASATVRTARPLQMNTCAPEDAIEEAPFQSPREMRRQSRRKPRTDRNFIAFGCARLQLVEPVAELHAPIRGLRDRAPCPAAAPHESERNEQPPAVVML